MSIVGDKNAARIRRRKSIRKKLSGTSARPRLAVFRSSEHIYAQIIDDTAGVTLASASTLLREFRERAFDSKKDAAKAVGHYLAEQAKAAGIRDVVFDRGGFLYHGRIAALAEAARESGLNF